MSHAVIYRCSDRVSYVDRSLPHLLDHTSPGTPVIVVANASDFETLERLDDHVRAAVKNYVASAADRAVVVLHTPRLLGVAGSLNQGAEEARQRFDPTSVMVVDDDVLVPLPQHHPVAGGPPRHNRMVFWDQALARMLEAGWRIAGHPWSPSFWAGTPVEVGGVAGYRRPHVAGGCTGFLLEDWMAHPMHGQTLIHGFTHWQMRIGGPDRIGYCADPPMTFVHFDRPEHPFSQRDTTYAAWSELMYYERWPERRNPTHSHHTRPLGQEGSW